MKITYIYLKIGMQANYNEKHLTQMGISSYVDAEK